ncbi:MAG TPA: hypothetical protein VMY78_07945 [Solirubrobacteraceae bacterium]|nr:hypothetical protein [Solirubrobacteraceae bacterium]
MCPGARRLAISAVVVIALLAGCGEDGADSTAAPGADDDAPVALSIRYSDGAGQVLTGTLRCTESEQRATGSLGRRAPAAQQCSHVRDITSLLIQEPPADRSCSEVFGGPQTVRITGTIGDRRIDRRFRRTNGCEIADFTRVSGALPVAG